MVASLRGHEPGSRGMSTDGRRYQAVTENTKSLCDN
jgi:hypothetical protein